MKPIKDVDLEELHGKDVHLLKRDDMFSYHFQQNLTGLLDALQVQDHSVKFKDKLLAVIQLYFDGLTTKYDSDDKPVNRGFFEDLFFNEDLWNGQKRVFDDLITAGKDCVGSFYRGEDIDYYGIREMLSAHSDDILKYGSPSQGKSRHLSGKETHVQFFGKRLPEIVEKTGSPDTLVCIATGAFEPTLLAMDVLENDNLVAVGYRGSSHTEWKPNQMIVPYEAPKDYLASQVKGKDILVFEDETISGKTLASVMKRISKLKPDSLNGVSVYSRPIDDNKIISTEFTGVEPTNEDCSRHAYAVR